MSNPNTPEPILSSVATETQVPDEHGTEIMVTEPVKSKKKCIVISLIRHAQVRPLLFLTLNTHFQLMLQCESNCSKKVEGDPLTDYGREQAHHLGNDWKDVCIDVLHASTLQRASQTANEIPKGNHNDNLEVRTYDIYVEEDTDQSISGALTPHDYQLPGGESIEQVALRAKQSLVTLLEKYAKKLDEPFKEFLDKVVIDSPNELPTSIPHVVVVRHNRFLSKFYDSMYGWNKVHR